jgi:DNA-binding LacI/PurR family transcriptional regulator
VNSEASTTGAAVGAASLQNVAPLRRVATIYDVARAAGVSHQTVSRLLKGGSGIRPENRERIERALKELDYRPNMAARSLATNRSHRIGALVYEMAELGPSKIIQGSTEAAREAGYLLDIVSLDPRDHGAIEDAVALLANQHLAGILAYAPTEEIKQAIAQAKFSVPVYVDTEEDDLMPGHETSLNGHGLRILVNHLIELGHRNFFHISGPQSWLSAGNRQAAYDLALADQGLTSIGTIPGDWSAASGYEAVLRMPLDRGITALVAGNDQMALGALRALAERGVRVPEDMSVVGFDDLPESRFFQPPLTTVRLDFGQQGRLALLRLLSLIGDAEALPNVVGVLPELKVRQSSGPVGVR